MQVTPASDKKQADESGVQGQAQFQRQGGGWAGERVCGGRGHTLRGGGLAGMQSRSIGQRGGACEDDSGGTTEVCTDAGGDKNVFLKRLIYNLEGATVLPSNTELEDLS